MIQAFESREGMRMKTDSDTRWDFAQSVDGDSIWG